MASVHDRFVERVAANAHRREAEFVALHDGAADHINAVQALYDAADSSTDTTTTTTTGA